ENVLCCGFGHEELFKVADFGVARPGTIAATFGGLVKGTPGYAAPELFAKDERGVGPWTDVFSFAALVYFLLTGEPYFTFPGSSDLMTAINNPRRRSITESSALPPELGEREPACKAIDEALAWATTPRPEE